MRIVDNLSGRQRDMQLAKSHLFQKQKVATTGYKLHRAADNAPAAARLEHIDDQSIAASQYLGNIKQSISLLQAGDDALASVSDLLLRAKEIAVGLNNGSYSDSDRDLGARELREIREQLIVLSNTRHGDSYIFAGYSDDQMAFDTNGAYQGSTTGKQVLADDNYLVDGSIPGNEVFGTDGLHNLDIFASIENLATAMENDDFQGISTGIIEMQDANDQITASRSRYGRVINGLNTQVEILDSRLYNLSVQKDKLANADTVTALTELVQAEGALESTLQVTGRVLSQMNLINYI